MARCALLVFLTCQKPVQAMDRDLAQAPRKQPAAVPAPEALQAAWQWVTLLCCTAAQTRLPPAALQLLSDLVQLLYYYAQQAGPGPGPVPDQAEPRSQLQVLSHGPSHVYMVLMGGRCQS